MLQWEFKTFQAMGITISLLHLTLHASTATLKAIESHVLHSTLNVHPLCFQSSEKTFA